MLFANCNQLFLCVFADGPRSKVTLQRSLSDRLSPGADPQTTPFNDTMRLRMRVARRDARDSFPGADECDKPGERRLLSPGRPRPKEPPPPPPPPAPASPVAARNSSVYNSTPPQIISLQVNATSPPCSPVLTRPLKSSSAVDFVQQLSPSLSIINIPAAESPTPPCPPPMPPPLPEMIVSMPPKLPPRQIFRFTKEEIEKLNQNRVQKEESRIPFLSADRDPYEPETGPTETISRSLEITNCISITCDSDTVLPPAWNRNTVDCSDDADKRISFLSSSSDQTGSLERQTISITSNQTTDDRFGSSSSETMIKVLVPSPDTTDVTILPKEMDFFNGQNCTIVKVLSLIHI